MFHAFWFAVKIALFALAALWVAQRPGTVQIEWLEYNIQAHVGLVLLALLVAVILILFLHRAVFAVARLPQVYRHKQALKNKDKTYRTIVQGLSAVAAGDADKATAQADKARALNPDDKGLSLLLEAQAARLRGEEDVARACFQKLLDHKDTAFLGLRGLLVNALESGNTGRALVLGQKALAMHPRQEWVIRLVYDLEVQERQWESAERTLRKARLAGIIDEDKAHKDRLAMLIGHGDDLLDQGQSGKALALYKKAHKLDPAFVPAAQRLAARLIETRKNRAARTVIERSWKQSPHPDLAALWEQLTPAGKRSEISTRVRWAEKLVAITPDSAEAQLAAAQAALDADLWGEARQYLNMAEQIAPSARLYRLYARLEERAGDPDEAHRWLAKAADAPADKVWTCRESGQVYERWLPVAPPHGSFNTVIWDVPRARPLLLPETRMPENELLITAR